MDFDEISAIRETRKILTALKVSNKEGLITTYAAFFWARNVRVVTCLFTELLAVLNLPSSVYIAALTATLSMKSSERESFLSAVRVILTARHGVESSERNISGLI